MKFKEQQLTPRVLIPALSKSWKTRGYIKTVKLCVTVMRTFFSTRLWFKKIIFIVPSFKEAQLRRRVLASPTPRLASKYGKYQIYKEMCQYFENHKNLTQSKVVKVRSLIVQPFKGGPRNVIPAIAYDDMSGPATRCIYQSYKAMCRPK